MGLVHMRQYATFSTYGDQGPPQAAGSNKPRKGLMVIGLIILVIGLALAAIGASAMFSVPNEPAGSEDEFNDQTQSTMTGFGMVGAGFFLMFLGGVLLMIGFGAGRSRYYGGARSSVNWSGGMGKPANEFPQEGDNVGTSRPPQVEDEAEEIDEDDDGEKEKSPKKEVVKVKCRECGHLEEEDAEFCSKCGKRI